MISFYNWIENQTSLSVPQHKKGESSMDLNGIVEKRMMQMILELEREGKGNRQDILKSIKKTIGVDSEELQKNSNLGDSMQDGMNSSTQDGMGGSI